VTRFYHHIEQTLKVFEAFRQSFHKIIRLVIPNPEFVKSVGLQGLTY